MNAADGFDRIHHAVEAQVRRSPDAPAVIVGTRTLTFAELNTRANRLARRLRDAGVAPGDAVGIYLDRDEHLIPALLAALKAGAVYVPLDPAYPAARCAFITGDVGLRQVISRAPHASAGWLAGVEVLDVDAPDDHSGSDLGIDGGDAAYLIYTSGSTGRPKGVVVGHRNALALTRWALETYSADERRGVLAATSICFDVSIMEVFPTLVGGGTVILGDNLLSLPTLPARERVTMICGVPSVLAVALREPMPRSLLTVNPGGEALTRGLAERIFAAGARRVVNCYGPTECTTYSVTAEVRRGDPGEPPIGRPVAGSTLHLRTESGQPVADGEPGELWISGPLVTMGYHGRPELTAERFVRLPDGTVAYRTGDLCRWSGEDLEYLGRRDTQVKIRGYRVELGELEAALSSHPAVDLAIAVAPADANGTRYLAAFVEATTTVADLRDHLVARLPNHLVPSRLIVMDRIPVGPTGKADRAALLELVTSTRHEPDKAPRSPVEHELAAMFAQVLGVSDVGVTERFTDLGGHSLAVMRCCAAIEDRFGVRVPVDEFLATPTVAALASTIAGRTGALVSTVAGPTGALPDRSAPAVRPGSATTPAPAGRTPGQRDFPLTDMQANIWATREFVEPGAATVAVRLRIRGLPSQRALGRALDDIVARHEVLRSAFIRSGSTVRMVVGDPKPVPVTGYDLSELPPAQRRQRMDALFADAATRHFPLTGAVPLLHCTLAWVGDGEAEMVIAADHIAVDGWSVAVLMREIATGVTATGQLPAPPIQVADVALRERSSAPAAQVAYWRAELTGVVGPTDLPRTAPPGTAAGGTGRVTRPADPTWAARIADTARTIGVSPAACHVAALAIVIAGMTGRSEALIGVTHARRGHRDLDDVIGPLVGVLPIRVETGAGRTFAEVATAAAGTIAKGLSNADVASADMFAAIDRRPGDFATPVLLSVQPPQVPTRIETGDVTVELLGELNSGAATRDVAILVNETVDGTELIVEYDAARFSVADAEHLLDQFERAGTAAGDQPVQAGATPGNQPVHAGATAVGAGRAEPPPAAAYPSKAPQPTGVEEVLARVWSRVLGADTVARTDDFFELGGQSLAAALMVSELRETLRCRVPNRLIFDRPVLADFAAAIEELLTR